MGRRIWALILRAQFFSWAREVLQLEMILIYFENIL